jgi:hypothetical protein
MTPVLGLLYMGTNGVPGGTEVWRSTPGYVWSQINRDGFGDSNNISAASMATVGWGLHVGTQNQNGGEIWRYSGDVIFWDDFELGNLSRWSIFLP